tara:strand:- start:86 stop:451 length:366 start_codon:yes stop_codon:yes gene_type:complete
MATKKPRYPTSIPFHHMGFDWEIKFIDIEATDFGETDSDQKEVRIYYRNRTDQNVIETLLHELFHVVMFELADSVFHFEKEKPYEKEENLTRLISPRVFAIIRGNPKLVDFVMKKIKELDK